MSKRFPPAILILILLLAAQPAEAADTECGTLPTGTVATEVTYHHVAYTSDNMLCNGPSEPNPQICSLQGLLLVPQGAIGAPAVILSHGGSNSNKHEESFLCPARYFLEHHFVVFMPLRRGYSMDGPDIDNAAKLIESSGRFSEDILDALEAWHQWPEFFFFPREVLPYWAACNQSKWGQVKDCLDSKLLHAETAEIGLAMRWLKLQTVGLPGAPPLVNPGKIALLGHSGGGKVSVMSGAVLAGIEHPQVVISLSMAEKGEFGNNAYVDSDLIDSATNAQAPMALLQPANADSISSTRILGMAAAQNRRQYLAQIFPPVEPGDNVHGDFFEKEHEVNRWGPVARFFMAISGVE